MKKLATALFLFLLVAWSAPADAAFKTGYRYGFVANTAGNRALIRNSIQVKVCVHTSVAKVRRSCDKSRLVVKFNRRKLRRLTNKEEPPNLVTLNVVWRTHEAVLARLELPAWACPGP